MIRWRGHQGHAFQHAISQLNIEVSDQGKANIDQNTDISPNPHHTSSHFYITYRNSHRRIWELRRAITLPQSSQSSL
jgi:hypothetical protein